MGYTKAGKIKNFEERTVQTKREKNIIIPSPLVKIHHLRPIDSIDRPKAITLAKKRKKKRIRIRVTYLAVDTLGLHGCCVR